MKKLHLFLALVLALTLAGTALAQEISASTADNSTYDTVPATGLTAEAKGDTTLGTDASLPTAADAGGSNTTCDTNPCHSGNTNPGPGNTSNNGNTSNGGASGGRRGGIGGNADDGTAVDLSNLLNYLGTTIHPQSVLLATPTLGAVSTSHEVISSETPGTVASNTATSTSENNQLAAAGALGQLGGWSWFWAVVILVVILGLAIYLVRRPSQQ